MSERRGHTLHMVAALVGDEDTLRNNKHESEGRGKGGLYLIILILFNGSM